MASALMRSTGAMSCVGNSVAASKSISMGWRRRSSWHQTLHLQAQPLHHRETLNSIPSNIQFKEMCSTKRHLAVVLFASQEPPVELAKKKCVPCETKILRPMSRGSAETMAEQVPGWNIMEDEGKLRLTRAWKTKTFLKGLEFFRLVADVAEAEGHHPDLHLVGWNRLSIDIWTHSIGGLTENDFILAAKINAIDAKDLFRQSIHAAK